MAIYDRPVRGADVAGAAASMPGAAATAARVRALLDPERTFASAADLRRALPPEALGITPGAWATLFDPLFGEFE